MQYLFNLVYNTETAKFNAVIDEIVEMREEGRRLVGTVSIEASERLAHAHPARNTPRCAQCQHEREASIVTGAGQPRRDDRDKYARSVPTSPLVPASAEAGGGLHIIGTEQHEARRIDNQLRGRSRRPGDPGSTRFYLSLDDELMRRFRTNPGHHGPARHG